MSTDYRILPPADWSKDELMWQAVASDAEETLRMGQNARLIMVGDASCLAWTDSSQYIALSRTLLKDLPKNIKGLTKLGGTLLHEYCHSTPSNEAHDHDQDFYEAFHNAAINCLGNFLDVAAVSLGRRLNGRAAQRLLKLDREVDREEIDVDG